MTARDATLVFTGGLAVGTLGGLAVENRVNPNFLTKILFDTRYPAARYFDIMNFHHYGSRAEARQKMEYVRYALRQVGASDKPIWITETGYSSDPSQQNDPNYRGLEGQVQWLRDMIPYLLDTLGAEKVFWYRLYDYPAGFRPDDRSRYHGLIDNQGNPKPSYFAYKEITRRAQTTVGLGCRNTSVAGLISLPELGPETHLGSQAGLYPNGANEPPADWVQAGLLAAGEVLPRDADGNPSENGKIVLLSIGESNTMHEWTGHSPYFEGTADGFMPQAARYADRNPHLVIVNGAVPGRSANAIVPGGVYYTTYWPMVMMSLSQAGVTAKQVQVIWLKETNPCPGQQICGNRDLTPARGDWPGYAQELQHDLEQVVKELEGRFPNLKQIFVSPRTYGGYALSTINPEPFAFETGFAVKWLIEERINAGRTTPWLDWGPYLWANGLVPNAQGLTWACEDFVESDRTHPSKSGVAKVGKALLDFFTTSPYTRTWFLKRLSSAVLEQNYPHPFNTSTYPNPSNSSITISFSLPTTGQVSLRVCDVLGREVAKLVNGEMRPGEYSVVFDAKDLPSGVYFYQLKACNFVVQGKMVVTK